MEEGYIKFNVQWQKADALSDRELDDIRYWRNEMRRLNLIGVYGDGVGFGNISQRRGFGSFIISGSATGHIENIQPEHFTTVVDYDLEKNMVWCKGPVIASSESLSHAVLYSELPEITGIIHAHHGIMWERLLDKVPTTDAAATYGSQEMAHSIMRLSNEINLLEEKIFVMKGHQDGIFTFGKNLEEAANVLIKYLRH